MIQFKCVILSVMLQQKSIRRDGVLKVKALGLPPVGRVLKEAKRVRSLLALFLLNLPINPTSVYTNLV